MGQGTTGHVVQHTLVRSEPIDIAIERMAAHVNDKEKRQNNSHQGANCPEGMKWRNLPGAHRTSPTTTAWEPSDELIISLV